jgi:2-(1,2-epoxy-1,2-dihydrophenyl)acetyl-CoA isomerase
VSKAGVTISIIQRSCRLTATGKESLVVQNNTVLYQCEDGAAWITLNRLDHLNAYDLELPHAFVDAVSRADKDEEVRAIVITGAGRAFSAGADVKQIPPFHDRGEDWPVGQILREHYNEMIAVVAETDKPTVAMLNGVAAGAGASLALACDFRIASEDASFYLAFVNLGLIPDCGLWYFLPRIVGMPKALEFSMLGPKVDIGEAERIGLVNRVVPAPHLRAETKAFAAQLVGMPTMALARMKRALHFGATHSLRDTLGYEADLQAELEGTDDHREGVKAFFEKRSPVFKGQ